MGRFDQFNRRLAYDRYRRPAAGAPKRREAASVAPHLPFVTPSRSTQLGGFLSFASTRSGDKVAPKAAIRRDRPAGSAKVVAPAT